MAKKTLWPRWLKLWNQSRRRASFGCRFVSKPRLESLEQRLAPATVQFSVGSETVDENAGTFSIPVTETSSNTTLAPTFAGPGGLAFDSAGNLYGATINGSTVDKLTPAGGVTTFASGFVFTQGLAFDLAGNLYVCDPEGGTVSKVTPAGVISTFASGFGSPDGLAFDLAGNLYVASNSDSGGTVSKVTPAGVVSTFATGFGSPQGLAFDSAGNLYVANEFDNGTGLGNTVSRVTPAGVPSTFATGFSRPVGLTFDSAKNLYVANELAGTVSKVTPGGAVSTFATGFSSPQALVFDSAGNLDVAGFHGLSQVDIGAVSLPFTLGGTAVAGTDYSGVTASPLVIPTGQTSGAITGTVLSDPGPGQTLTLTLGTPSGARLGSPAVNTLTINEPLGVQFSAASETVNETDGTSISTFASGFDGASGLAFDAAGNLYVANTNNGTTVSKITPARIASTFASGFQGPLGLAFDAAGNLYVANSGSIDSAGTTVSRVTPGGVPSTFASGLLYPQFLAFDSAGNLYVDNAAGSPIGTTVIRVTPAGVPSTFASEFNSSAGLAFDAAGNLYVANQEDGILDRVTAGGIISMFTSGFNSPLGLAFDAVGNLYVGNVVDGTVDKVTPDGTFSTFASGFDAPFGLAFDAAGNLYVANTADGTISKVTGSVGTFSIPVVLSAASAVDTTVPFTLGGTAIAGNDYSGVTASPLVIPAGQTIGYITGTLIPDPGPSQTLTFTLGAPTGGGLGSPSVNTLRINEPTTVQFSTVSETVSGSAGSFSIPVVLSAASAVDTIVPFRLGGTALVGNDYSGVAASPLVIPAGQTTGFITGTLIPDPGLSQTLTFTLGTPTGASLRGPATNTLTIDGPPTNVAVVTAPFGYLTVTAPSGTDLEGVNLTSTLPADPPAGVSFPFGLLSFELHGLFPGARATVTLTLPQGVSINTYYKYGRLPTDSNPTWYDFTANAQFLQGAGGSAGQESVVLNLTDGQAGDDDVSANGVIVDPGALGLTVPDATISGPIVVTRGQTAGFTISTTDVSSSARASGFTYAINWNDGSPLEIIAGTPGNGAGVPVNHVFESAGSYQVSATAMDSLGVIGPAVIFDVSVAPLPPPIPTVTVLGIHRRALRLPGKKTEKVLVVSFSGALDQAPAQDLRDYQLAALGKAGKARARASKPLALKSAVYSPATNTVTLLPKRSLPNQRLQLTIVAARTLDTEGRPIEANQGGNFEATIG